MKHDVWEEWVPRDTCYHAETAQWVHILEILVPHDVIAPIIHQYNRGLIQDYRTNLTLHYLREECLQMNVYAHNLAAPLRAEDIVRSLKQGGFKDLCQIAEMWYSVNHDHSLSMEQKEHVKDFHRARIYACGLSAGEAMAVLYCLINSNDGLRNYHPAWIRTPYSLWYMHEFTTPIAYAPVPIIVPN